MEYYIMKKIFYFLYSLNKNKNYAVLTIIMYFLFQLFGLCMYLLSTASFVQLILAFFDNAFLIFFTCLNAFIVLPSSVIISSTILKWFCRKKINFTLWLLPTCVIVTTILFLLASTWLLAWQNKEEYSEFLLNFIIPNIGLIFKNAGYFSTHCFLIAIAATTVISIICVFKSFRKAFCETCGTMKKEYVTAALLMPTNILDALKSDSVDLSLLENLKIGTCKSESFKIKLVSCSACRKGYISVIELDMENDPLSGKKLVENLIYENHDADYDWVQKLATHYENEFIKKN